MVDDSAELGDKGCGKYSENEGAGQLDECAVNLICAARVNHNQNARTVMSSPRVALKAQRQALPARAGSGGKTAYRAGENGFVRLNQGGR